MKVDNFVKDIERVKQDNKLDLSIGEDLSIALMNLISLEEHFMFSHVKTSEKKYLDFLEEIREMRKKLLAEIVIKDDDSEKWCISKHLLASSMRISEVATKYLHNGDKKKASDLYFDSFNLFSLFWAINGGEKKPLSSKSQIAQNDIKKDSNKKSKLSKISESMKKMLDCCRE